MALTEGFTESYRKCCSDCKTRLKVKSSDQDKCLEFNADPLEEQDWQPLLKALRSVRCLETLVIKSEYVTPRRPESRQQRRTGPLVRPAFHKATIMDELTESIVDCMRYSDSLSTLHLYAIPLTHDHVEQLAQGIRDCQSLQYLVLNRFDLEDQGLDTLYESIYLHVGLNMVDLSNCSLTDRGAETIARIIKTQQLARYDEKPDEEVVPGIRRFTLNNNPAIGDKGFAAIIHELMDDLWVKALDMQNCGLTDLSGKESLDLVTLNDSLWVLDLSRNAKISTANKKEIKNILASRKKQTADADTYKWLDAASEKTKSQISVKPNSEKNLRADNSSNRKKLLVPISQSQIVQCTLDLHHMKRDLDDTRRLMVKERLRREQLERERQEQKAMLDQKFTKELKKRKQVEKERDKLKMEFHKLISPEGHFPKRLIKPKRKKAKPIQEAPPSAVKIDSTGKDKPQKRFVQSSSASSGDSKPKRTRATLKQAAPILPTTKKETAKKPLEKNIYRPGYEVSNCYDSDESDLSLTDERAIKPNSIYEVANTQQLHNMQTNLGRLDFNKSEPNRRLGSESICYDSDEQDLSESDDSALESISTNAQTIPRDPPVAKRHSRTLSPLSRSKLIFSKIVSNQPTNVSKNFTSVNNAQPQTFYTESNVKRKIKV